MARTRSSDFEDKQRGILQGAAAVFAQLGMEKASMSHIATRAGVSKSLLYHYYPNKEALIFSIINSHIVHLDAEVAQADDPGLPAAQRLERLIAKVLETYRGADDAHKVQLNAGAALSHDQRRQIRDTEKRIVGRFAAVLRELNPRLADPGSHQLTPVTMSLFGMLNWVYTWFKEDGSLTRADYARIVAAIMTGGVKDIE